MNRVIGSAALSSLAVQRRPLGVFTVSSLLCGPAGASRFGGYKSSHVGKPKPAATPAPRPPLAVPASCKEDTGPIEQKPLSALQRRQMNMKEKKVFILTQRAVERVRFLINLHKEDHTAAPKDNNEPVMGSQSVADAATTQTGAEAYQEPIGIRIGVKRRGCSGYSYTVNYEFGGEEKIKNAASSVADAILRGAKSGGTADSGGDVHVEQDGVHIFVEGQALFYVIGTVMDYTITNVEEKFTFQNPNQKHSCGCGESFMPFDV